MLMFEGYEAPCKPLDSLSSDELKFLSISKETGIHIWSPQGKLNKPWIMRWTTVSPEFRRKRVEETFKGFPKANNMNGWLSGDQLLSHIQVNLNTKENLPKNVYRYIAANFFTGKTLNQEVTNRVKQLDQSYDFKMNIEPFDKLMVKQAIGFLDGSAVLDSKAAYTVIVCDKNYNVTHKLTGRVREQNNYRAETLAALHFVESTKEVPLVTAWIDCYPVE